MGHPQVNGMFIDDSWSAKGPSEEDPHSVDACGLSPSDVERLTDGWSANTAAAQVEIIRRGGFVNQLLYLQQHVHQAAVEGRVSMGVFEAQLQLRRLTDLSRLEKARFRNVTAAKRDG